MTALIRVFSGTSLLAFAAAPAFADDTGPIIVTARNAEEAAAQVAKIRARF